MLLYPFVFITSGILLTYCFYVVFTAVRSRGSNETKDQPDSSDSDVDRRKIVAALVPLILIALLVLIGVASMVAAFLIYTYGGGFSGKLSTQNQDWGAFGGYFGGVLAPIIGLISIAILGITLLQQQFLIQQQFKENVKQDVLRLVNSIQDDLEKLLDKEVVLSTGANVPFGDLVDGLVHGEPKDVEMYSRLLKRLLTVQQQYFNSIMLYRDNINSYFVYETHRRRLLEVQEFLETNRRFAEHWDKANIGVLRGFIEHSKL